RRRSRPRIHVERKCPEQQRPEAPRWQRVYGISRSDSGPMTAPVPAPPASQAHWALLARACIAQLLAVLGEHILLVTALPMWAYDRTHSAEGVSLALIAVTAPALLSLPAGAWTARFTTRRVLLGCGALRLLLTALMLGVRIS